MILSRTKIIRLYHFTKPILSSLNSLQDLESILQKKLIQNIKEVNQSRLKHYQFANSIAQQLKVSPTQAKQISTRTIQLSVVDARTQRPQTIQVKINQDLKKLKLQPFDFGFPFPQPNITKQHFSQFRGIPTFSQLNQYKLNKKNLFIFNLPDQITQQDIQATLKIKQIKVNFQYCILGLVAYARVQFQSEQSVQECLKRFPQKTIQFGDRIAAIKSVQDKKKIKLGNRRLVVNIDQNRSLAQMTIQFSKYGRVINIECPVEAWMNPTLEQVKRHYQNSSQLLKINQIFNDGTIQSEYFPALKAWQNLQDERQNENLIQKAEELQQSYEKRTRFARNINIYVGRQHEIITSNKGYCVVTYSTFQQCQNYYFATGSRDKIQLVADKLDFQYDPTFRRQLLRYIDNEFLIGQKKEFAQKKQHQKQFSEMIDMAQDQKITPNTQLSYKIAQKIFKRITYNQSMTRNSQMGYKIFKNKNRTNTLLEWKAYLNKMKAQKAHSKRKSFDELAQIELYGRVLPKDQQKQSLIIQDTTYTPHPYIELIRQHGLITDVKSLKIRKKFYRRQIERNNRLADKAHGRVYPEQQDNQDTDAIEQSQIPQLIQQIAVTQENGSGQIGKPNFSTKKPTPLYRKRTPKEYANFKMRFFQFTRNTIFEYMGIFQDKIIEEAADHKIQILNPQALKWPDGSSFLTEQELPNILQFRRNFEQAQQDYNDYILGSQYLKSSGANLEEIFGNFNELQAQALQYLTDVGVVEQAKKVAGQNLRQKVNVLNSQVSNFGEEYRVQQGDNNNTNYLIKIRKLQHLLPIDRVAHLEKFISDHGQDVTKSQSEIFSKYYNQIKQKDFIPDQVSEAFGIEKGKRFSDLLAEVGAPHQIFKKDLEMAERAKTYSSEALKNDLDSQIKLQKTRKRFRKVNSNSFSKDPSQIYVKDRQGYYKVSRFRQI